MADPRSHQGNLAFLKEDRNFKLWYDNNRNGSAIAADIYLRNVGLFCRAIKKTPKEYASLPLVEMEEAAQNYVNELQRRINPKTKKHYSPGYVQNILDSIRNWAAWNRKAFERKIKIKDADSTPSLEEERIPTQEELRRNLYGDKTPIRTRASIAIMAFSGCRPEVQGNYDGTDGLRIKDLPEMQLTAKGEVKFLKIPTVIVVRKEISKIRKQYFTFLASEGCDILKEYIERRIRDEGEVLDRNSGIIVTSKEQAERSSHFGLKDSSPFLTTPKISESIRESMRAAGLPWRPYVFRSYFDTNLMMAEGKGLISHAYQQFVMGHSGDIERRYTLSKNTLPEEVIEELRQSYKRASQYLATIKSKDESANLLRDFKEGLLLSKGRTPEEVRKMDVLSMSNEEFFKVLNAPKSADKSGADAPPSISLRDGDSPSNQTPLQQQQQQEGRHTAIPLSQLPSFLAGGALFIDKYTDPETSQPMAVVSFRV